MSTQTPTEYDARERRAPIYSVAEVARLAGVSAVIVRRWMFGEDAVAPLPPSGGRGPLLVSFLTLIEIVVAKGFRHRRVRLARIRRAHDFAVERLGTDYPFASLRLRALGGQILAEFDQESPGEGNLLVLDRSVEPGSEQWTLPVLVRQTIEAIEYASDELAKRWFPLGKDVPIVVDPRLAAGQPTITGTGVTVRAVHSRFKQELPMDFIARDLRLKRTEIEAALRFGCAAA